MKMMAMLMMAPMFLMGQAFRYSGAMAWKEMMILDQSSNHSLFQPDLTGNKGSACNRAVLISVSNPFGIQGLTQMEAAFNQKLEQAALGFATVIKGGGPFNCVSLSANYSQMITETISMGLSMGGMVSRWEGLGAKKNLGMDSKFLYRITSRTAWESSIGIEKEATNKKDPVRKHWSTAIGHMLNQSLFMAMRLEKEDGLDPSLQMLINWKPDTKFAFMGGYNIASGSVTLGWEHWGKQNRQGVIINNHSLLGYGMEVFLCHTWK